MNTSPASPDYQPDHEPTEEDRTAYLQMREQEESKPRRLSVAKNMDLVSVTTRLESLKGNLEECVEFCTNAMQSTGYVYRCSIDADGMAVVISSRSWWSQTFTKDSSEFAGKVLGKVWIKSSTWNLSMFQLAINGDLCEGRG